MTIRPGVAWGEPSVVPPTASIAPDDRALQRWVADRRHAGLALVGIALSAGDLARTCGRTEPLAVGDTCVVVPVDVVRVTAEPGTADQRVTWAVSHVIARRGWWRGTVALAMNAEFLGAYDVAPRAHPNDGRVDTLVVDPSVSPRQRWAARSRARHGQHVPHPGLATASARSAEWRFPRPVAVWIDGARWTTASTVSLAVEPDALTLYV